MGEKTGIHWADRTFNYFWGCTKVTQGCKNCYAEELAKRSGRIPEGYIKGSPRIKSKSHNLAMLRRWDKLAELDGRMHRVFAHSMSDVFDQEVPDEWRCEEFSMMQQTKNLWYLILTKRPEHTLPFLMRYPEFKPFFERAVWLGTSITGYEDSDMANEIVKCPAKLHWVSYEPALSFLDVYRLPDEISWIVVGGESGAQARPFRLEWARDVIVDFKDAVFVKQTGKNAWNLGKPYPTPLDKSHGANPQDWPEHIRVQDYPLD